MIWDEVAMPELNNYCIDWLWSVSTVFDCVSGVCYYGLAKLQLANSYSNVLG